MWNSFRELSATADGGNQHFSLMATPATAHMPPPSSEENKIFNDWLQGPSERILTSLALPAGFKQRRYTWINCAEQRLNLGWCVTRGSFFCPARTHITELPIVFTSGSHWSKNRLPLHTLVRGGPNVVKMVPMLLKSRVGPSYTFPPLGRLLRSARGRGRLQGKLPQEAPLVHNCHLYPVISEWISFRFSGLPSGSQAVTTKNKTVLRTSTNYGDLYLRLETICFFV